MDKVSGDQFIKNTLWKFIERFGARGVSLIFSMILARLLTPNDYGLIACTTVFTSISDILIDAGFGTALVRKKTVDEYDYASVFVMNSVISIMLYLLLFFFAPFISAFYKEKSLIPVLRIMGLVLFVQAFHSTRNAYMNRNMQFKLSTECNIVSSVLSGIAGIMFAYFGGGVWSLVVQRLMQQSLLTILLFWKVRWRPRWRFSMDRIREMLGFSTGVIAASLINYTENCVNNIIIGRCYTISDLGYSEKANILPEQIAMNSFGAMSNVLLPTISSYQDDRMRLKKVIRKIFSYTAFFIIPMMLGLMFVSKEAIIVLFTEKWSGSVPMMKWFCIYNIATPLMLIDVQVFFALGRSEIRVKTEIIRLFFILSGIILCCFVFHGSIVHLTMVNAIAASMAAFVTNYAVYKLIGYSFMERMKDAVKPAIASIGMLLTEYFVSICLYHYVDFEIVKLFIMILAGFASYCLISVMINKTQCKEILDIIKRMIKK